MFAFGFSPSPDEEPTTWAASVAIASELPLDRRSPRFPSYLHLREMLTTR